MPAENWHHLEVEAAKAASMLALRARMKMQLSLEMLASMLISLLIVLFVLREFQASRTLIYRAASEISKIAKSANQYQYGFLT